MNLILARLRRRIKIAMPAPTIKPHAFAPDVLEPARKKPIAAALAKIRARIADHIGSVQDGDDVPASYVWFVCALTAALYLWAARA